MSKITIVKVGGAVLENSAKRETFLNTFLGIEGPKILVHGGGVLANQLGDQLGVPSAMIDGRRITCEKTIDIVTMVYGGKINKTLSAYLSSHGCQAIGLCGGDMQLILSQKRSKNPIDYGFVGDIIRINSEKLEALLAANICPVIAPLTSDKGGQLLNTNADTIAATIAQSLSQKGHEIKIYFTMELSGVLTDPSDPASLLSAMDEPTHNRLKNEKIISGGMIPKLENCFKVKRDGAAKVYVCGSQALVPSFDDHPSPATEIIL